MFIGERGRHPKTAGRGLVSRRNEHFKFNERDVEGAVPYEFEIVKKPSTVNKLAIVLDRRGRRLDAP